MEALPRAAVLSVLEHTDLSDYPGVAASCSTLGNPRYRAFLLRAALDSIETQAKHAPSVDFPAPMMVAPIVLGHDAMDDTHESYECFEEPKRDMFLFCIAGAVSVLRGWVSLGDAWTPPRRAPGRPSSCMKPYASLRHGAWFRFLGTDGEALRAAVSEDLDWTTLGDERILDTIRYMASPRCLKYVQEEDDEYRMRYLWDWLLQAAASEAQRRGLGSPQTIAREAALRRELQTTDAPLPTPPPSAGHLPRPAATLAAVKARIGRLGRADVRHPRLCRAPTQASRVVQVARLALLSRLPYALRWLPTAEATLRATLEVSRPEHFAREWGPSGPRQPSPLQRMLDVEPEDVPEDLMEAVRALVRSSEWPAARDVAASGAVIQAVHGFVEAMVC